MEKFLYSALVAGLLVIIGLIFTMLMAAGMFYIMELLPIDMPAILAVPIILSPVIVLIWIGGTWIHYSSKDK